jgi:hypothetical protein
LELLQRRYDTALFAFGAFGADAFLWQFLSDRLPVLRTYVQAKMLDSIHMGLNGLHSPFSRPTAEALTDPNTPDATMLVNTVHATLNLYAPHFNQEGAFIHPSQLSPKMNTLVTELLAKKKDDFQGIIFASQRLTVFTLCWLLQRIVGIGEWIRPDSLIGHGSDQGSLGSGMDGKKQQSVRKLFRDGVINLRKPSSSMSHCK